MTRLPDPEALAFPDLADLPRARNRQNTDRIECDLTLDEIEALTLQQAMLRSDGIIRAAVKRWNPVAVIGLYSGGNDSTTMMHLLRPHLTHAAHINTGIGIDETRTFVRDTCAAWSLPLIEEQPPPGCTYRELVLRFGFPGPAGHGLMYSRLKERGLREVRRRFIVTPRKDRVLFVAGMRLAESARRERNANEEHRDGSTVWVSPIIHWTTKLMGEYRDRHDVPHNEVTDHLHMSGECLCGAFAKPGELEQIRFFYPAMAEQIEALEGEARAAGVHATWGTRPPRGATLTAPSVGVLCQKCELPFGEGVQ